MRLRPHRMLSAPERCCVPGRTGTQQGAWSQAPVCWPRSSGLRIFRIRKIRLSYSLALALFVRRLFLLVRLGILRELSYNDPILSLQINAPQCQLCQAGELRKGEPKIEQERAEK